MIRFMIRSLKPSGPATPFDLIKIAEIGRNGGNLRLGQVVRGWHHDGGCIPPRTLTAFLAPIRQFLDRVGKELPGQPWLDCAPG
jgi:hypothetical protein